MHTRILSNYVYNPQRCLIDSKNIWFRTYIKKRFQWQQLKVFRFQLLSSLLILNKPSKPHGNQFVNLANHTNFPLWDGMISVRSDYLDNRVIQRQSWLLNRSSKQLYREGWNAGWEWGGGCREKEATTVAGSGFDEEE